MNPNASRVSFDALRELGFAGLSGAYAQVGTTLTVPVRIIKIANTTDADIVISFDGVTDQDIVPVGSFVLYDFCSNASEQAGYLELNANQAIWAAEASTPATSGSVFVTIVYANTK